MDSYLELLGYSQSIQAFSLIRDPHWSIQFILKGWGHNTWSFPRPKTASFRGWMGSTPLLQNRKDLWFETFWDNRMVTFLIGCMLGLTWFTVQIAVTITFLAYNYHWYNHRSPNFGEYNPVGCCHTLKCAALQRELNVVQHLKTTTIPFGWRAGYPFPFSIMKDTLQIKAD